LKEAIESTLNQTYTDFKYIIIDDCSTDESVKLIESYNDSRIKFIKNDINLGTSKTINRVLSLIDTKYAVRLDQDDVSLPERVDQQISYLEKNPNVDIICSWEHSIDENGNKIRDWKAEIKNYGEFLGPVLLGLCPVWHPSIAFRTKAMINAGGFDPTYTRAEDFEVTARMAIKRYNAAIVPEFLLLQREHNNRQSILYEGIQRDVNQKIQKNALQFFLKHDLINEFASFLRIEDVPGIKRDKIQLLEYNKILEKLFEEVKVKQNLTNHEMETLKIIFVKRIGYGIIYCQYFRFLPNILFKLCFNILSPLSNPTIRKPLSKLYHRIFH